MRSCCLLRARWGFLSHCHSRTHFVDSRRCPARRKKNRTTSRALTLLVHALFRKAYGDTEEPGLAITSVHHKDSIAKEGDGFTRFNRANPCDGEAVMRTEADVAADLVARASIHGLGPPLGKPRRSLAYT